MALSNVLAVLRLRGNASLFVRNVIRVDQQQVVHGRFIRRLGLSNVVALRSFRGALLRRQVVSRQEEDSSDLHVLLTNFFGAALVGVTIASAVMHITYCEDFLHPSILRATSGPITYKVVLFLLRRAMSRAMGDRSMLL